jgi:hypothetical protein
MAGTPMRSTKLRTVHPQWWRSRDFWMTVVFLLVVAALVVARTLDPHGGGGG